MAAAVPPEQAPYDDINEEEEEELEDLPEAEKQVDPLRDAIIRRTLDGKEFSGRVEDIERGKITKDRLYRIKYEDGDLEHLMADQVKKMMVSKAEAKSTTTKAPEEAGEEEAAEEEA